MKDDKEFDRHNFDIKSEVLRLRDNLHRHNNDASHVKAVAAYERLEELNKMSNKNLWQWTKELWPVLTITVLSISSFTLYCHLSFANNEKDHCLLRGEQAAAVAAVSEKFTHEMTKLKDDLTEKSTAQNLQVLQAITELKTEMRLSRKQGC